MIIYEDTEAVLVEELINKLSTDTDPITQNVYVSTKKPLSDANISETKIITIRNDGGGEQSPVTRVERVGINIYADTAEEASHLALTVEAILRTIANSSIKRVEIILSQTRVDEQGPQERRYITAEVTTKAKTK